MPRQIPMISSGVAGSLGVLHLPRLWQKASLAAVGKLHPNYVSCGKGFDQLVLDGLKIERGEFLGFISAGKPGYLETERWILERNGGRLDASKVEALNKCIAEYTHDEATREAILADCGIECAGGARDAITLNNLDDWDEFHRTVFE